MTKAIEKQVGGDHYTNMKRQPIEKTYDTYGYEGVKHAIYTKVDKYLTRDKGTDRVDLCKAIHCLELQLGFYDQSQEAEEIEDFYAHPTISLLKDDPHQLLADKIERKIERKVSEISLPHPTYTFEPIDKGTVEEQELREGIDTYPNYEFEAKGNV
jgi:hypothetical protein